MLPEIIFFSILSIFILIIRNRKINFTDIKLEIKGYKILIAAAVIEITAEYLYGNFSHNNLLGVLSLNWLIYLALIIVAALNFKKTFMKLLLIGTLLNFIAIASNDFKMPVLVSDLLANADANRLYLGTGQDLIHSLLTEDTKFKILCDVITLAPPYPFPKSISIGDIFLFLGVFAFWQELPRYTK